MKQHFYLQTSRSNSCPKPIAAIILAAFLLGPTLVYSQGPAFPPIGYDTNGPGIILTINANGTLSVTRTDQGPYDNIEDTYIGIVNYSPRTINSIRLQSPNPIFGFDGDGICGNDPNTGVPFNPAAPGCPFIDPNGYGGPGVTFSGINATATAGTVNFNGGLAQGQWTYFGLEEAIETTCDPIPDVPSLKQFDPAWASHTYNDDSPLDSNGRPNSIGRWGCFLTACAMLINYHALAQDIAFSTDPDALNTWLNDNGGYDSNGGVIPVAVANYARLHNVDLWYTGGVGYKKNCVSDDFTVDSYLCANEPVILRVTNPVSGHDHFVLATGGTNGAGKFLVNDPGYSGRDDLTAYNSSYCGVRMFSSMQTPSHALWIVAHSPVELLITDPAGNKTGFEPVTGQESNQIPAATYVFESIGDDDDPTNGTARPESKILDLPVPVDGVYLLKVFGTGTGAFTIDFAAYDSNGEPSTQTVTGMAAPGSVAEFEVNYSSAPGSQITVTAANYTINVSAGTGGTASGSGVFATGSNVTVTATSNSGYNFANWTQNGTVVSTSPAYTFAVTSDRTLVANFVPTPTVSITETPSGINEGGSSFYRISASTTNPSQPIVVNYSMSGTAILGTHYTLTGTPGQVTIPPNASQGVVTLRALVTALKKGSEKATMTLNPGTGYKLASPTKKIKQPNQGTVTIYNR